jgi:hypothetical protein
MRMDRKETPMVREVEKERYVSGLPGTQEACRGIK